MRLFRFFLVLLLVCAAANAATFTVTTTNDSGAGSLRDAIISVNASADATNTIAFAIGTGAVTIHPNTPYSPLYKKVVIDGTTQPGYSGAPIVEVEGSGITGIGPMYGLRLAAGNSTIKGLVLNRWYNGSPNQGLGTYTAIDLASSGNTVTGCYIGTDVTGTAVRKNNVGIRIENGMSYNVIGTSSASAATRNLISGNDRGLESTYGSGVTGSNSIKGNFVGVTAAGNAFLDNYYGIYLDTMQGTIVGGTGANEGNLFGENALGLVLNSVSGTVVRGNRFGGFSSTALGGGLFIGGGSSNTIGGTTAGSGNSFSNISGMAIGLQDSPHNVIQGNTINNVGSAIGLTSSWGAATNNMIGGTAEGAGNTIRGSHGNPMGAAVRIIGDATVRNSILRNSIAQSDSLGIDLGDDGTTANDAGDGDGGPNGRQNFPVLNVVTSGGGSTTIAGTLNSAPNGSYRIEFFANTACDSSGYGEGENYLGYTIVATDPSGTGSFLYTFAGTLASTVSVTATATDGNGSTSEFSACRGVTGAGVLAFAATTSSVNEGAGNATVAVTRYSGATGGVTINYATANGTATAGSDYTATAATLSFGDGETSKSILVPIIDDALYEGNETFTVMLSTPGGGALLSTPVSDTVTIVDNDEPGTLTIADTSVAEGNSGTTTATFTVTMNRALPATASVNWATANGTATAGSDYQAASGTLTFNPGETQKTISVVVNGDPTWEPDETFSVILSGPSNCLIGRAASVGTITNDDPQPFITVDNVRVVEGTGRQTTATLTLTANQPLTTTVQYGTVDGTAKGGSDYTPVSGTLTWNGETTKQITVTVNGDSDPEPDEQFTVHFTATDPHVKFSHGDVIVTIANDDVGIVPSSLTLQKGQKGSLAADFGNPVTTAATLGVTASDTCIGVPATVDLPAGAHAASVSVDALTAPCTARVDVLLPPSLGGNKLSASVRTYAPLQITFDPPQPQIYVGQTINVAVTATPLDTPLTLQLTAAPTVEVPATVTINPAGGSFALKGIAAGPIIVTMAIPQAYGGGNVALYGTVVAAPVSLTILDVTPKSGPAIGGTQVTITGTSFTSDCTFTFDTAAATNVVFTGSTTMSAVTPAHKAGVSDVTASCGGNSYTLKNAFVYTGGAPSITAITPSSGSTAGGTTVRIDGVDFTADCWVDFGGLLAHDVSVESATEMIATTPAHPAGRVVVSLHCKGPGSGSLPDGFTYVESAEPAPVVTGVDPSSAAPGERVTVSGSHFRKSDVVTFDTAEASVAVTTPDKHIVIVPSLTAGKVSVTVKDADGHASTTGPTFTVLDANAPKITRMTPPVVPPGAELTIDGSGFRQPYSFRIGAAAAATVVLSYTRAVVRVPALPAGGADLEIVKPNGDVVANGGKVTIAAGGIVVLSSPFCVPADGGSLLSILGRGFDPQATVSIGGVAATNVHVVDSGHIDATVPPLPPGLATIVVTNPSGDYGTATNTVSVYSRFNPDSCGATPRQRPVHR